MPDKPLAPPAIAKRLPAASELPLSASVKYNPHLWGDAELRAIFVVRRHELETLLDAVRSTSPASVPQHVLITGHRGMGKTTLLRRVALAVRDDLNLSRDWLALSFPEEQYTVSNLTELWRNVLDALADALERQGSLPDELARLDTAIVEIGSLPVAVQEEAALALLTECSARCAQRILLLVDSTDLLFAGLGGGGSQRSEGKGVTIRDAGATPLWRLRKTLSHEKGIFWLGASFQALEAQHPYQDAFHDFFHLVELGPLSVADMREAMLALARTFGMGAGLQGEAAAVEMARALDSRPERLKALRAMTGGNPRTTVMLYDLLAAGGDGNVHNDLRGLLDMMTPLYKARMESLSEQPRKLLAHLMELWAPRTAKALADASGLPVTTVSGQLSRLETEGLVEKARLPGGKRNGYQVAERFFNVWYLMRYASRRLRQRLTWLVEFMRLWFSAEELADLAHARTSRHVEGHMCDEAGLEYSRALASALPEGHCERYRLEWSVFSAARSLTRHTRRAVGELFDLEGEDRQFAIANDYLERFRALDPELERCPHVGSGELAEWVRAVKGSLNLTLDEKARMARESDTLSESKYRRLRDIFLREQLDYSTRFSEHAAQVVYRAVREGRFFPDCPDSKLAQTQLEAAFSQEPGALRLALHLLAGHLSDAWLEKAYREAIKLDERCAVLWSGLGKFLRHQPGRYDEAEAAYRRAIELDVKFAGPWYGIGILKRHLRRYDEAEAAYRRAIELDEHHARPWNDLGNSLVLLKRYDEAEAAYRRAIELDEHHARPWNDLGDVLVLLKRYDEAETAYRRAIELDGEVAHTWCGMGNLLPSLKRYDEAEAAYRKAIELDGKFAYPWSGLGDLLGYDLNRYLEAEAAYRKAIELDGEYASPWFGLGNLLQYQLQRYDEAETAYRKAIELDEKFAYPWNGLGNLLQYRLERYDEAEAAYRKAIELDGEYSSPWNRLGNLLQHQLRRYDEAEAAYRKAIELDPGSAAPWNTLGSLLQYDLQRYDEAEAAYRKAIELDGEYAFPWYGLGNLLMNLHVKRYDEAEAAYRKAIELDPDSAAPWNALGNLLQDQLKSYNDAEAAYHKAMELDRDDPYPVANLARMEVVTGQIELAALHYRRAADLAASIRLPKGAGIEIALQSQLWLGNRDAARLALETLARQAVNGDRRAFFRVREQALECHRIGIGVGLASLMEESAYGDFLKPFSLALRAAGADGEDVLAGAPPEVALLAQEVYAEIRRCTASAA